MLRAFGIGLGVATTRPIVWPETMIAACTPLPPYEIQSALSAGEILASDRNTLAHDRRRGGPTSRIARSGFWRRTGYRPRWAHPRRSHGEHGLPRLMQSSRNAYAFALAPKSSSYSRESR